MAQARGSQAVFALYDETTYGQNPGTPAGQKLYLTKFGVRAVQDLQRSETLTSDRIPVEPIAGNIDVVDSLAMEISAQDIGKLLKHLMGGVSTAGTNPYTHTITPGALPIGCILEKDHGANISGVGRFEYFNGVRFPSADFTFPKNGFPTAQFNVVGANGTLASSALDASLDDYGHTSFSAFDATIQEGGGAIAVVTEAKIRVDNDIDGDSYYIGGAGKRGQPQEGFCYVSGSITAMFADVTLFTKAVNRTESSLAITLSRGTGLGSAGNESISFTVNQLKYKRTSPAIEGPGGVLVAFDFESYRKGATAPLTIVVKNAVSAL